MSNSELFLIKGDQEGVEFDILKRPSREFHHVTASHDPSDQLGDDQQVVTAAEAQEDGDKKQDKCKDDAFTSLRKHREQGEYNSTHHDHDHAHEDDEDEDGFKTPTSLNHKIPVITECPTAPRKLFKSKRKSSSASPSPHVRRSLRLDLTQEVESLFPKPLLDDLRRKIKKARRENKHME